MIKQVLALVKKDFLLEKSYRVAFILNIFSVSSSLLIYFFIDKLFGHKMTPHLEEFGVDYFSYVLVSMAFFSYIGVGAGSFSGKIREEQMQGTLESLFLTPTKIPVLLLSMGIWNVIFATINVVIYILLGIFLFNVDFSNINLASAFLVLILTIISFSSLGILGASFIMVIKRGNPVDWVLNTLEGILGGVYFPVAVMPHAFKAISKFLPITYAIRAMELAVYRNYSIALLKNEISSLLLFSILLVPLSILSFRYALDRARRHGSLSLY